MASSIVITAILLLQTVTAVEIKTCICTQLKQVGILAQTELMTCSKPFQTMNMSEIV